MRTPGAAGDDRALAVGFLHGEGLLPSLADLAAIGPVLNPAIGRPNVVELTLRAPVDPDRLTRHFYASSSCGVCGKSSLKALATMAEPIVSDLRLDATTLLSLPARLRQHQATFKRTGSLHAAGLFEADGEIICVYEDVGRHNAVDKAVGACLLGDRLPLDRAILLVSGRTSFEIVQKAIMARIPLVAAISGPSTLAADLADQFGITLVGFLRDGRFNIYSHPERISTPTLNFDEGQVFERC